MSPNSYRVNKLIYVIIKKQHVAIGKTMNKSDLCGDTRDNKTCYVNKFIFIVLIIYFEIKREMNKRKI